MSLKQVRSNSIIYRQGKQIDFWWYSLFFTTLMTHRHGSSWILQEPSIWTPWVCWRATEPWLLCKISNRKHILIYHPKHEKKEFFTKMAITRPKIDGFSTSWRLFCGSGNGWEGGIGLFEKSPKLRLLQPLKKIEKILNISKLCSRSNLKL